MLILTLPSYSLPWVVEHLGLEPFDHHDALEDARASALASIAMGELSGESSLDALLTRTLVRASPT